MKKKFYMIMAGAAITAMAAFAATSLNGSVVGNDPGTPGNFKPIFEEGSPTADVKADSYEVTVNVDFSGNGYAIYDKTNQEEAVAIPSGEDYKIKCQLQEEVEGVWKNIETVKYAYAGNGTSWTFTATPGEHTYHVVASIERESISDPVKVTVEPILVSIADVLALSRSENPTEDILYLDVTDAVVTFAFDEVIFIENDEAAISFVFEDSELPVKEGDVLEGYLAGMLYTEYVNFVALTDDSKYTATPGANVEFGEEIDLADVDKNVNRLVTFKASDDTEFEEVPGGLSIKQGSYELNVFDPWDLDIDFEGNIVSVTGILYDLGSNVDLTSQTQQPKANIILFPRSQADIVVENPITLEEALALAPNTSANVDIAGWQVTFVDEYGRAFMQNETSAVMVQVGEDITLVEDDYFLENSIADITILAENIIALNTLDADPINYMPAMPKTITPADAAANVNRFVRFEASADAPIEDGEISENISVGDYLQAFDDDFEIPYYIESVSGILVDPMAMQMDDEDAEEGFYCLAPRSEQDIVAFEFVAPEPIAIDIKKDKPEQKLEISWNPAENQAPFLVMGYKVAVLDEDNKVIVESDILDKDVTKWSTDYLPNGDYTVRVTTFFTGEETAVSTKSYNMVGISVLNADEDLQIFDLQGRRVADPAEGLYIINGKKTVIRK